ncbi:MAG: PilZ domain-containing protein [Myxococcota bacterium]
MKRVAGVLQAERRRALRHAVDLRIFYVWTGVIFEARTIDVSITGMCLQTQVDLGKGSILETRFAPSEEAPMQAIEAEVMWSRPVRTPQDNESFQCGLRFLSVRGEFLRLLQEVLPKNRQSDNEIPMADANDVIELREPSLVDFDAAVQLRDTVRTETERHGELQVENEKSIVQAKLRSDDGDLVGAIGILEKAVAKLPSSTEALEALGEALYRKGDVLRAVSCFDRALRIRQETEH